MDLHFEDDPECTDEELAFLRDIQDAVNRLDDGARERLEREAQQRGRDLVEQVLYVLKAHRGLCPVDDGDLETADFARIFPIMKSGRPLQG